MCERRYCTVRFNLSKEEHKKAWMHLQTMDRNKCKSYSNIIIIALNAYFDKSEALAAENALVDRIVKAVKNTVGVSAAVSEEKEEDIAWDFLGGEYTDIEI